METKVCTKCGRELPLSDFYNNKSKKDGKTSECKYCYKEYSDANKEKIKEYQKEYRENNKEKIKDYKKEYNKEYYENNKERRKEYCENNKEKINKYYRNRRKEDELFAVTCRCRRRIQNFIKKVGIKRHQKHLK